jgi:hypothetical protein
MAEQAAGNTTTVRVTSETRARLRVLADKRGVSITKVVADAVDALNEKEFWADVRQSFARLRADPDAWADYQREFGEWNDATMSDGLEPEEWTDADFVVPPRPR